MQWVASESAAFAREGTAPGSSPKYTARLGRESAREEQSEQSALRHIVASGALSSARRMLPRVWVTSP